MAPGHAGLAMGLDEEIMIVAGIGCRQHVSAAEVKAAIEAAMQHVLPPGKTLNVIAIPASKGAEPGVFAAAATLGIGLVLIPQNALETESPRTLTRSARSLAEMNVHSVAEAAALAGAGANSRLLGARIVAGPVTCALAETQL